MKISILAWAALGGLVLAGCASEDKTTAQPGGEKKLKVGIVFDSGGRGDKSFNDSAYAGIERAVKELGVESREIESKAEKDYEGNLSAIADQGMDLVFAVGISQKTALEAVAPKYPNVKFALVDAEIADAANVRSLVFAEEQGSFLAGYLAGLVSKTQKLGFVGGKSIPLIKKFEVGYIAGAKTAKPSIEVLPAKYTESWDDINGGKVAARVLLGQGADIVYHAAGRCGLGVIDAAREAGKYAIGVDSDQDSVAPGNVLTSMMKRVDNAVFATIQDAKDGKFSSGVVRYDAKNGGVGLSPMTHTKDKIGAENLAKVDAIAKDIADGKITVPKTPEELAAFLKA